jgi:hypothetical protein
MGGTAGSESEVLGFPPIPQKDAEWMGHDALAGLRDDDIGGTLPGASQRFLVSHPFRKRRGMDGAVHWLT